ncbi:MAG: hypothetical protein KC668_11920 [Myxococcales bacterium]|nr:hypothetical protein [Myxococcales bacterium]
MNDQKQRNATRRGFATPEIDTAATTGELMPPPAAQPAASPGDTPSAAQVARPPVQVGPSMADLHANTPVVEIEVIHQHGPAPNTDRPFQTLEVWTQNTIYVMDPTMQCVGVRDRATQQTQAAHPFIGRRLVGGQTRNGETIQLSYPYPRPGTEAVFEEGKQRVGGGFGGFAQTSTVTRVVLRLHMVTVTPAALTPTWAEITRNTGGMPAVKL